MYLSRSIYIILILLILLILPNAALANPAESTEMRLASDVWPPFTDVEGKVRRAIDLMEAALARSQISSRTRITSWNEVIAGLKNKTIDGCAAMWRSAEREEFLLFSRPYLENRLVLVGRAGSAVNDLQVADLRGKRLALVRGYAYGSILDDAKNVIVVFGESDAANLEAVLAGKADYMLADELLVHQLFESYPKKSQQLLAAGTTSLISRALHFAIRKDYPGAQKIITAFNQNIEHLIADGTYNRLLQLAWIRTDVSGDGVEDYVSTGSAQPKAPKAGAGYRLFLHEPLNAASKGKPSYVIDGKEYKSWDEASRWIGSTEPRKEEKPARQDKVGVVLFRF